MPKRRYYPQEKANTCAVAALRTVLAIQFDKRIAEPVLEALGTQAHEPIRKHGTGTAELRDMVWLASRAFNTGKSWTVNPRCYGTLAILRKITEERPVLVRVYRPHSGPGTNYHMMVVLSVSRARLRIFDPATPDGPTSIMHHTFLAEWLDPDGIAWYATIGGG